jgi:hypothetical protein
MQCSSCKSESLNLREYSRPVEDARGRKNIETLNLCPRCRIVHVITLLTRSKSSTAVRHRAA